MMLSVFVSSLQHNPRLLLLRMQLIYASVPLGDLRCSCTPCMFFLLDNFYFSLIYLFVTYFCSRVWGYTFILGIFKNEAILNTFTEVRCGAFVLVLFLACSSPNVSSDI